MCLRSYSNAFPLTISDFDQYHSKLFISRTLLFHIFGLSILCSCTSFIVMYLLLIKTKVNFHYLAEK